MSETERKVMEAVLVTIEEAALRGLPAGPFTVLMPVKICTEIGEEVYAPTQTVALSWDHESVRRLLQHVKLAARDLYGRAEEYESELRRENEELREALKEAANSLESAGRYDRVPFEDVREYCLSRSRVALDALNPKKKP